MRKIYRAILLKKEDEELGECWGATLFFDNGTNEVIDCSDVRGVAVEIHRIEEAHKEAQAREEQREEFLQAIKGSIDLSDYATSWVEDEDGCVELCIMSDIECYDIEPTDMEQATEAREVREVLVKAGCDVVSMSGAGWEGCSDATPEPGNCRRVLVRLPGFRVEEPEPVEEGRDKREESYFEELHRILDAHPQDRAMRVDRAVIEGTIGEMTWAAEQVGLAQLAIENLEDQLRGLQEQEGRGGASNDTGPRCPAKDASNVPA